MKYEVYKVDQYPSFRIVRGVKITRFNSLIQYFDENTKVQYIGKLRTYSVSLRNKNEGQFVLLPGDILTIRRFSGQHCFTALEDNEYNSFALKYFIPADPESVRAYSEAEKANNARIYKHKTNLQST